MRVSVKEALQRGWITAASAKELQKEKPKNGFNPQQAIFNRLSELYPGLASWEEKNLVPGRKFRADIFIKESGIVIEMDGFQHHKSKIQFQRDREKRNLMVTQGYVVLAFYFKQVKDNLDDVIALIIQTHEMRKAGSK